MACAARRARLRPRTVWRASQRSNRVLNTTFHTTATADDTTAATPARCQPAVGKRGQAHAGGGDGDQLVERDEDDSAADALHGVDAVSQSTDCGRGFRVGTLLSAGS
jgi:hypothetical protein